MAITTISAAEIQSIQVIDASKNVVLIVTQRNSNRPIVVKSEETRERNNVGAMLEFHATLFSKLRALPFETERLALAEINALKACSPTKLQGAVPFSQQSWLALLDEKVLHIGASKEMKSVIKISYIEELANLQGMAGKAVQIQQLCQLLSQGGRDAEELLSEIGEILAVDFFIGNGDRFEDQDKQGPVWFRGSIKGEQNIFFQAQNGKFQAVGIDTYDAGSIWSDLNATIEQLEPKADQYGYGTWPGRILAPGAERQRDAAARAVVNSLVTFAFAGGGGAIAPPNDSVKAKLAKACHPGISRAKGMLRSKFNLNDSLQGLSAGLASRWRIVKG
jgi:hypothetical protein